MKRNFWIASLVLSGLFTHTSSGTESCPGPKYSGIEGYCDSLQSGHDSGLLYIEVDFYRPPPAEEDIPANRAKLRMWTDSLYLTFELREGGLPFPIPVPSERLLPPKDSELQWTQPRVAASRQTIRAIVEKSYVKRVFINQAVRVTGVSDIGRSRSGSQGVNSPFVDVLGKSIAEPASALKKIRIPLPR